MLLQTNSYIVPKEKRAEHARLLRRFRQTLARLGCDHFEVYEQVGSNWSGTEATGRYVQIMRFRDRRHQQQVQAAERTDPQAQGVIREFCQLINFPYQQQQGLFAIGFYSSVLPAMPARTDAAPGAEAEQLETAGEEAADAGGGQTESAAEDQSNAPPPPPIQALSAEKDLVPEASTDTVGGEEMELDIGDAPLGEASLEQEISMDDLQNLDAPNDGDLTAISEERDESPLEGSRQLERDDVFSHEQVKPAEPARGAADSPGPAGEPNPDRVSH